MKTIGIRKEDKNIWEKRVPLIPDHIKHLIDEYGIKFLVETFPERAFNDIDFKNVGAKIVDNLSDADAIIAVKEIPIDLIQKDKTYMFFSHTIKGQDYNMPLLKKIMDNNCKAYCSISESF